MAVAQDEKIDKFLEKYKDSVVVYNAGVNRIVLQQGLENGVVAQKGDEVTFDYVGSTFDSAIGNQFAAGSFTAILGKGEMIAGLDKGIEGMKVGERSYILFSCANGYDTTVAGVSKTSALIFEVMLTEVKK
ncbi:MAG: FKBP-type peptidyl-prolyl cis-trans isomerase [Bacteroidales bacterium]|nr:FKBP-type peptidyl-prolyl cis-trans isomerase [Bacteroidales bacterium]